MSVQETAGSSIAFAAIIHLGATVPTRLLRCVLNCEDMVALKTAKIAAVFTGGAFSPRFAWAGNHRRRRCPRRTDHDVGRLEI